MLSEVNTDGCDSQVDCWMLRHWNIPVAESSQPLAMNAMISAQDALMKSCF